eukprot:2553188-Pyramimonas_sp.AAC.1
MIGDACHDPGGIERRDEVETSFLRAAAAHDHSSLIARARAVHGRSRIGKCARWEATDQIIHRSCVVAVSSSRVIAHMRMHA